MEKFCSSLGEHVTTILNFEKEKTVTVNNKKMLNISQDVINFYICEKRILLKIRNIKTVEIIAILQVNIEVEHVAFVI